MDSKVLRSALAKLHEELGRAPRVDAESRELLRQLSTDIERLVDQPTPQSSMKAHRPRLEELEVKFEVEHPALAETVREIIDALGKAGL
jgi:hypothetical protein